MAQAEHDPDAVALLVTTSRTLAQAVRDAVDEQLSALPPTNPARKSLAAKRRHPARAQYRSGGALCQSLCAGASEHSRRAKQRFCAATGRGGQRVSSARGARSRSAIMPAAPITCCRPAVARVRAAGFPPGILCVARACSKCRARDCAGWRRWFRRWRMPRGWWRTARRRGAPNEARRVAAGANAQEAIRSDFAVSCVLRCAAFGALCGAGRRPRREAAPRFQREHGGLLARGACARCAT